MTVKHRETSGGKKTPEWMVWSSMVSRCSVTQKHVQPRYAGRGIAVCQRWLGDDGYENFLADMGRRPTTAYSIERKNNNGHYEPDNCCWATKKQQARNRRSNKTFVVDSSTRTMAECAELAQLPYTLIKDRIRDGWSIDRAMHEPIHRSVAVSPGTKFNKWTVVEAVKADGRGRISYSCRCSCGSEAVVKAFDLLNSRSTRCKHCAGKATLGEWNKGAARRLVVDGVQLTISECAARHSTSIGLIYSRLNSGWSDEEAVKGRCFRAPRSDKGKPRKE